MAKPELGTKRLCQSCGAKFYDLSRTPPVCPRCGTVFQALPVATSRSSRAAAPVAAAAAPAAADDDEIELDPAAAAEDLVSLEEVAEGEEPKTLPGGDDIEVSSDAEEDDAFLEEEEEGDDVSDLIDGDIEDDEEA